MPTKLFPVLTQRHKRERTTTPISLNGTIMQVSNSIKYLYVILDNKLTVQNCILQVKGRAHAALNTFTAYIRQNPTQTKITLIQDIHKSILLYSVPMWGSTAKSHFTKLEAFFFSS